MEKKYLTDCYNKDYKIKYGDHDDPRMVNIFHIDYIYLPSNPNNKVEVIIKDHDDITNPCFYILTEDRSKELYKISLFNNSITDGLTNEDKKCLNNFLRGINTSVNSSIINIMKTDWILSNMGDYDITPYDNIVDPPYYE